MKLNKLKIVRRITAKLLAVLLFFGFVPSLSAKQVKLNEPNLLRRNILQFFESFSLTIGDKTYARCVSSLNSLLGLSTGVEI